MGSVAVVHRLSWPLAYGIFWTRGQTCVSYIGRQILFFFLYWGKIALQNFVVFCQTSTCISHRYTYISSLLNLPPKWVNFMACKLYLNKTVKNTFLKKGQSISNHYTKWFIWPPFTSEIIQFAKIWVMNALSESMYFVRMHTCMNMKINEKLLIYFSGNP